MSHRIKQKQEARELKQAALEKQQKRNGFWKIAPLTGGLLILGMLSYFALKPEKKVQMPHQVPISAMRKHYEPSPQPGHSAQSDSLVRKARKLVMSARSYDNDIQASYQAAFDSINSSGIVSHITGGRYGAIEALEGWNPFPRPDLEYFIVESNNKQGNVIRIKFDPRLMAFFQLLDLAAGGDVHDLKFSWIKFVKANGILMDSYNLPATQSISKLDAGYIHRTYSTGEEFGRDSIACVDAATATASLIYLADQLPPPRLAQIFLYSVAHDKGDKTKSRLFRARLEHLIAVCPLGDSSLMIIDPLFNQGFNSIMDYMNNSRLKNEIIPLFDSLKAANPVLRSEESESYFAITLLPTASEISEDMAYWLRLNNDVRALGDSSQNYADYMNGKKDASYKLLEKGASANEIFLKAGYVEGRYNY